MNAIPAYTAGQIAARLDDVAMMLRAMRYIAESAEDYEALGCAVVGLAERSHLIIDACIRKLGTQGLGNYNDNEWDDGDDQAAEVDAELLETAS